MIDPEIDAKEEAGYYVITIGTDYGDAKITVEKWVADMALSEARKTIEDGADAYQDLFDRVEEALND